MSHKLWTLESELCNLTGTSSLKDALFSLKMLRPSALDFEIRTQEDWELGGAETYIFRFWVKEYKGVEVGYIIKVFMGFSIGQNGRDRVAQLLERRGILSNCGVRVPKLFYSGKGLIIEELIPWLLRDRLALKDEHFQNMIMLLTEYAGYLAQQRFFPIGAFHDLRSSGTDVVAIDFGSDLGAARSQNGNGMRIFEDMLTTIRKWGISLDALTISIMEKRFEEIANLHH